MGEEKSSGYQRWMACGLVGTVLVVGAVWYAVSNLTQGKGISNVDMLAAAEAASPVGSGNADMSKVAPAMIAAPAMNRMLLLSHQDDPLIIQAYNAFQAKDSSTLKMLSERSTDHPLRDYVGYWYWKRKLEESVLSTEFNDAIQAWLTAHPNTLVAERLRQDWLKKQLPSITPRFLPEYDLLSDPDDELVCATWLLRGQPANEKKVEAKMWSMNKELPPACEQWLSWRAQQGDMAKMHYRLYNAALLKNPRLVARIAASQGKLAPTNWADAYNVPDRWLNRRESLDSPWDIVAMLRLLTLSSFQEARIRPFLSKVAGPLQKDAYTFLGYGLSKRLKNEAVNYFREGLLSSDLPHDVLLWRLRAMLRQSLWTDVLQTAMVVPDVLQEQESAWKYWRARALTETKKDIDAKPLYESLSQEPHYYGVLAREALGQSWPTITVPAMPSQTDVAMMSNDSAIQRALVLARLDWRDEGRREWAWALRNAKDAQLNAASYIAAQYQHYDWAINTAGRTQKDHNISLRFLAPFQGIAEQSGQQFQVPSAWVLGVIRQESRFYPRSRSSVGALGLMQLMPATAKEVARKIGFSQAELNALIDPNVNIPMGTYYMHELMTNLGSPVKVTAAYNAGASRAKAWQMPQQALDGAIYVETIPFNETRNYVKRVLSNWYFYHRVLGNKTNLMLGRILGTIPAAGEKASDWSDDDSSIAGGA